jgi:hypothetical protein
MSPFCPVSLSGSTPDLCHPVFNRPSRQGRRFRSSEFRSSLPKPPRSFPYRWRCRGLRHQSAGRASTASRGPARRALIWRAMIPASASAPTAGADYSEQKRTPKGTVPRKLLLFYGEIGRRRMAANGNLAEREGFEPPIQLPVCRISSAVLSTAQPPLQRASEASLYTHRRRETSRPKGAPRGLSRGPDGFRRRLRAPAPEGQTREPPRPHTIYPSAPLISPGQNGAGHAIRAQLRRTVAQAASGVPPWKNG